MHYLNRTPELITPLSYDVIILNSLTINSYYTYIQSTISIVRVLCGRYVTNHRATISNAMWGASATGTTH